MGTIFVDNLMPKRLDNLPNLPAAQREEVVIHRIAYGIAAGDPAFRVNYDEDERTAFSCWIREAVDGVHYSVSDIQAGRQRTLTLMGEIGRSLVDRPSVLIEWPESMTSEGIAKTLVRAYQKFPGSNPDAVRAMARKFIPG